MGIWTEATAQERRDTIECLTVNAHQPLVVDASDAALRWYCNVERITVIELDPVWLTPPPEV